MTPSETERLLSEDAWLRRLARGLVRDPGLADDLVQETWVAALSAPAAARQRGPWLRGTLRNLWRELSRSEARRAGRERRVEPRGPGAPTDELVEELSLRRELVDGLLALEEPYRTVLYRRFLKGESLRAVAAFQGVSVSTIHGRLERGLELLRTHLDAAHGGDRRAWMVLLTPLARPLGSAGLTLGGLAMGTLVKAAAATVVVIGTVGMWIELRQAPDREVDSAGLASPAEERDESAAATTLVPQAGAVARRAPEPSATAPEATGSRPAEGSPGSLRGRVVDLEGRALADLELTYRPADAEPLSTQSDGEGAFVLDLPAGVPAPALGSGPRSVLGADAAFALGNPGLRLLFVSPMAAGGVLLVAADAHRYAGIVVDEKGDPVPDAGISLRLAHQLFRRLGVEHGPGVNAVRWSARSGPDGRFELPEGVGGTDVFLLVEKIGFLDGVVDLPDYDEPDLVATLVAMEEAYTVTGVVLDPHGDGLAGARVSLGSDIVTTGEGGAFTLTWDPVRLRGSPYERGADGVWRARKTQTHLAALHPDYAPVRRELSLELVREPVVLRLGTDPLSISGRVVDGAGEPRRNVQIWLTDPTYFGQIEITSGESVVHSERNLERLSGDGEPGAVTDAEGRFRLPGLLDREYRLQAFDPVSASYGPGWTLAAGSTGVTLRLEDDPSAVAVAGVVVSWGGEPLAGVSLRPVRRSGAGERPPFNSSGAVQADDQGRFAFGTLAAEGTQLHLSGEGFFMHIERLDEVEGDLSDLRLVVPLLGELRVTLDDAGAADQLAVLDAEGEPLELVISRGPYLSVTQKAVLSEGSSSVIQVDQRASTLVLSLEGREVARRPLTVTPGERTDVRH